MSENDQVWLRSRIAANTGRKDYPDSSWEVLVAGGHVDDFLAHRVTEERFMEYVKALAFYGDLVEHAEAPPASGDGRPNAPQQPPSDGNEGQRAMTLASYLELRVAAHPEVLEWRRDAWGEPNPASPRYAYDLAEDAGLRAYFSGLPDPDDDEAEPSGELKYFGSEPAQEHRVPFYRGSLLERLRDLSEILVADLFPLWTQPEAAWLAVTGEVREVPACLKGKIEGFSNRYLTYRTVHLQVEPWIPADTVTRAYQYLQGEVLGRKPRALSERNLTMTRFVMHQLRDLIADGSEDEKDLASMSWNKVMDLWNQACPQWAYDDKRQFYRDCRRVTRSVARPYDEVHVLGERPEQASLSIPRNQANDKQP